MSSVTSQQLAKQVLGLLTRHPQSLALQQLPFLQLLQCKQPCSSSMGATATTAAPAPWAEGVRFYARLPERQTSPYSHTNAATQQQPRNKQQQPYPKLSNGPVQKLYRGKWIIPVRFLVRAKIFQLMGGGSIGVVIGSLTMQDAGWMDIMALAGLAGGMVAASYCLWYYSRRYVGEMSLLLPDRKHVRLSVLDFWGNREDNDVPIEAIQTFKGVRPKEISRITSQLLFPVNVTGDRQYYFNNIHEADIIDREIFYKILKGEFDPDSAVSSNTAAQQQPEEQTQ